MSMADPWDASSHKNDPMRSCLKDIRNDAMRDRRKSELGCCSRATLSMSSVTANNCLRSALRKRGLRVLPDASGRCAASSAAATVSASARVTWSTVCMASMARRLVGRALSSCLHILASTAWCDRFMSARTPLPVPASVSLSLSLLSLPPPLSTLSRAAGRRLDGLCDGWWAGCTVDLRCLR